jgi:hypothetical protein
MEKLIDPLNDREINSVELPPWKPLSHDLLFPICLGGLPDIDLLKEFLVKEGKIDKESVIHLA